MKQTIDICGPAPHHGAGRAGGRLRAGAGARAEERRRRRPRRRRPTAARPADAGRRRRTSRSPRRAPTSSSRGTRARNIVRQAPQVVSVLSSEDIARTGEGDIAGALQRVTGLSRGRQRLRLRARPRRPLFAGAAQRLAAAEPRAAAPRRPARHLPDRGDRQLARPEELFGQLSGRVRRRRDQPHHPGGAARGLPRRRRQHLAATSRRPSTSAIPITARDRDSLGFDNGTRDFPAGAAQRRGRRHVQRRTTAAQRRDFAASLVNAPTTLLQRAGRHAGQFLGRAQRRRLARDTRRPDRLHRRGRLQQQPGARATRSSRPRSTPASPARRRPASRPSPPTTGSSSTR